MSNKPARTVEAEVLGLPLEERARLAYRLLDSMDTDLEARPSQRAPLPAVARAPGADDGTPRSEPPLIPVETTGARPVSSTPDSIDVLGGALVDDVVQAILSRLPSVNRAEVEQLLAPTRDGAVELELAPSSSVNRRLNDLERNSVVDWESRLPLDLASLEGEPPQPSIVGVGLTFPGLNRKRVVASSVGAGAAALAALGFAFQGREPVPTDFTRPLVPAVVPVQQAAWKEIPTIEIANEARAVVRADTSANRERRPVQAPRRPIMMTPAIPSLTQALMAADTVARPADILGGPIVMPTPPAPTRSTDDFPIRLASAGSPQLRAPSMTQPTPERSLGATTQPSLGPSTARTTNEEDGPVASLFDVPPQVRDANRIRAALERAYPSSLRDWGITGQAEMWFYVNEQGEVDSFRLKKTSGNKYLDQAALRAAQAFAFTPGRRDDEPVAGWVSLPIVFNGM